MWVRGLKLKNTKVKTFAKLSHPMWVRGLKLSQCSVKNYSRRSHPMWVRGLKHLKNQLIYITYGRTPCGCVD